MKLNEENGLKLEIKRSELNALIENGLKMWDEPDDIKNEGIDNILNILPSDKSIGIAYSAEGLHQKVKSSELIVCFLKMAENPDNNIKIYEQDWIIEEDES